MIKEKIRSLGSYEAEAFKEFNTFEHAEKVAVNRMLEDIRNKLNDVISESAE